MINIAAAWAVDREFVYIEGGTGRNGAGARGGARARAGRGAGAGGRAGGARARAGGFKKNLSERD